MREVRVTYYNDEGREQRVLGQLSEAAIIDLIDFVEGVDGDEEYERGEFI